MHQEEDGRVPPLGGMETDGADAAAEHGRTWTYPSLEEVMSEAVVQEVETYVTRRQNTATQCITTSPIMDLCLAAVRRRGDPVSKRWWEQEVLHL